MTRIIGHARHKDHPRLGVVTVEWGQSVSDTGWRLSCFTLDFGNHTAYISHDESTGKWIFEIRNSSRKVYDVTLFRGGDTPKNEGIALDEGTTELVSWFLTEALA